MKIFNEENGTKKVYVQMKDIMILTKTGIQTPTSVYEKYCDNSNLEKLNNQDEFLEFTQPEEINFFESLEWIIDYKKFRFLSDEKIKEQEKVLADEINKSYSDNRFTNPGQTNKKYLVQKTILLKYAIQSLEELLMFRKGQKQMPFPIVPDSEGFSLIGHDTYEHKIKGSLDPNKILLFRKDGKELSIHESISREFLQMGITLAIMDRNQKKIFIGNYATHNSLSSDNHYFIVEFKLTPYEDIKEEPKEEPKEEAGIKKIFKSLFNKNEKRIS